MCPVSVCSTFATLLGGIQQLRGPNFDLFWPPPPLEWTRVDILHTPSPCPRIIYNPRISNGILSLFGPRKKITKTIIVQWWFECANFCLKCIKICNVYPHFVENPKYITKKEKKIRWLREWFFIFMLLPRNVMTYLQTELKIFPKW